PLVEHGLVHAQFQTLAGTCLDDEERREHGEHEHDDRADAAEERKDGDTREQRRQESDERNDAVAARHLEALDDHRALIPGLLSRQLRQGEQGRVLLIAHQCPPPLRDDRRTVVMVVYVISISFSPKIVISERPERTSRALPADPRPVLRMLLPALMI